MLRTKQGDEVKRGDVFWAMVPSQNGTHITFGCRPYVIVSCNIANDSSPNVTAVPCTLRQKAKLPSHAYVDMNGKHNVVMTEQVQTFGKELLEGYVCSLSKEEMEMVNEALKIHLGMWSAEDCHEKA